MIKATIKLRRCAIALSLVAALVMASAVVQASEIMFNLRIERGKVQQNMRRIRVKQGDEVKLRWSADKTTIIHLHGYDIEMTVKPGAETEMSFVARATGRFPVSVHKPKAGGGHTHDPPLTHIEVHPR
jgi:hypothetical protein